jgi:hypothetical protein
MRQEDTIELVEEIITVESEETRVGPGADEDQNGLLEVTNRLALDEPIFELARNEDITKLEEGKVVIVLEEDRTMLVGGRAIVELDPA